MNPADDVAIRKPYYDRAVAAVRRVMGIPWSVAAAAALDASGVWQRIEELEHENERLRALLKPAFALIDGDRDITYIAARGCSLEPDSWLREAAVALAETQENAE